jgi:TolB-like protein/class 3 adenylate cyclase/Tfp pilus assembly protein PilF
LAREQRRLAAIVAADVVGYSRLMGRDESGTLARLREHRKQRFEPTLARHGGRLVKLTGDGALAEFPSAVDALGAAIEFQQAMADVNREQAEETAIVFRIGLHLGDLIVEDDDLYGDGVNVAARLEAEAPPGGIVISRAIREAVEGRLKAKLHALGELTLKNIERPIRAFRVEWDAADWTKAPESASQSAPLIRPAKPVLALPDRPSIAVLPFQNMSGDPEQEYFADGMVEDIITALSRFKSLFVIARNSSFTYKGRAVDIKQVGRELGVRYVLEGSVRKAGGKVRITGQLIDSDTGAHLWADRFDGLLEDVFDLQDQVTASVVAAIAPKITQAEIERARRKPAGSLDAYDLYLRALSLSHQFTPESLREAVAVLENALKIDPSYAPAAALSVFSFSWWHSETRAERPQTDEAVRLAKRTMAMATDDPDVLWMVGWGLAYLANENAAGASLIERSLTLNPNCAQAWLASGYVNCFGNRNDAAIDALERAARLSPLDPLGHLVKFAFALAHLQSKRYEEAIDWADRALTQKPAFFNAMCVRTTASGHLGRHEEGRKWVDRIRAISPDLTGQSYKGFLSGFFVPEAVTLQVDGLCKAGLPPE